MTNQEAGLYFGMAVHSSSSVLALAALLFLPAFPRAQSEEDAQAGIAALKSRFTGAAQRPPDAVAKAGLPPGGLTGWTPGNLADLGPAIEAASRAVRKLHDENPSAVAATPYGNGTLTNMEDSIKWATGLWGGSEMKRGCVSHQGVTLAAVKPVLKDGSLEARGVFVVRKIVGHHAVIVFPKGSDWKRTGVVLDGWIHQESDPAKMTFLFKDWYGPTSWKVALE